MVQIQGNVVESFDSFDLSEVSVHTIPNSFFLWWCVLLFFSHIWKHVVQCCKHDILYIQALLPTRRWFNTMLDDSHLVVSCHLSSLTQREKEGHLFCQVQYTSKHKEIYAREWLYECTLMIQTNSYLWYCPIFSVAGHAEVLHRFWDQWPDRKRPDGERDDHSALWQNHLPAGTN